MEDASKPTHQLKKVPPEGGWGYAVAIGMALPVAFGLGCLSSFGIMFGEFIARNGGSTSSVTIIFGTFFSASSFAGLFTNTLYRKFTMKTVGIFGGTIFSLGNFMSVFATSIEHLIVSFDVLQGFAFEICVPVAFATFNQYFVIRRVFVMNLAQAIIGILMMCFPVMVNFLMEMYGFRGMVAIISAISAHNILAMMLMHPVEWHYKIIEIPVQEQKLMEKNIHVTDKEIEMRQHRLSIEHMDKVHDKKDDDILMKLNRSKSLDPSQCVDFEQIKQRMPSVMSLGDWNATAALSENCVGRENGKWQKVVDFLDLTLLKDVVYVNIVMGMACALYSDNSFFTLHPLYLFELNFSQRETAMIVAAGASADLFGRISLAIISFIIQLRARHIYIVGAVGAIIVRFVFLTIFDYNGMLVITIVMGFFRPFVHVPIAIIFGDHLPQERFASGYGLFMFIQGNFAFLMGPFISWIRDFTQSYVICFHSLSFIMALCAVPWIVEEVWLLKMPA